MSKSQASQRRASEAPPRRTFLMLLTGLAGAVAAAAVAIPGVGYLAAAVRRTKVEWVSLGKVADFPAGETRLAVIPADKNELAQPWDGMTAKTGVWVRNLGQDSKYQQQFQVFAINCTHLGCPVEWFPQSGLFMCPCHGGVYYENGDHASGPPPRGLYHCEWHIEGDELKIQTPHLPTLQNTLTGKNERMT
jgi:Rieske Fe-S protein